METLIRYRVLLDLIWFCTVCLCPTKRTLGLCGWIALYEKNAFFHVCEMKKSLMCYLFSWVFFFSENTRLFGITWASLWENLSSGGFDKACFKPVSYAIETSLKIEISPAASLHMILFKKRIKRRWSDCADAQAVLRLCCSQTPEYRVSRVEAHIIAEFMIRAIVNELHLTFFLVFFNSHRKFILFCWIVLHFICFTKWCLTN